LDNSNNTPPTKTSLLGLPPELRQHIWRIFYGSVAVPHMRYACDYGGIETSGSADTTPLYVCKQIYAEATPILYASLKLHIVYNPHSPGQLEILPPRATRDVVREVFFHCGTMEFWGEDRPPKRPFPFHKYPRLATFRITKKTMVSVESLTHQHDDYDALTTTTTTTMTICLTPTTYAELSAEDKVKAWKRFGAVSAERVVRDIADFGRSGWLSRVVDPQTHTEPVSLEPDSDSEFDDEDWEEWTTVGASDSEPEEFKEDEEGGEKEAGTQKLSLFRGAVNRMKTIIELEYKLWHGEGLWRSSVIDTFLVTVDARDRRVIDYRLLSPEEVEFREEWSRRAS
jgi:hypothetical protein